MNRHKTIFIRVNEVRFDTISDLYLNTNCFLTIAYQPDRKYIENVTVTSAFFNLKKSKRNWTDMKNKYNCNLVIPDLETLSEIADCIKMSYDLTLRFFRAIQTADDLSKGQRSSS